MLQCTYLLIQKHIKAIEHCMLAPLAIRMTHQKNVYKEHGPLPRGRYKIHAPIRKHGVGKYALQLEPNQGNHMCGRSLFYIHGDDKKKLGHGSEGCIVADPVLRHIIWESGDRELEVI